MSSHKGIDVRANIYHHDICPENIISYNGSYYLIDWGLSQRSNEDVKYWSGHAHYTSIFHDHYSECPYTCEDDIESLIYVICELYMGLLPWRSIAEKRDSDISNIIGDLQFFNDDLMKCRQRYLSKLTKSSLNHQ